MFLRWRRFLAHHLEAAAGHDNAPPPAASKQTRLAHRLIANDRLCDARVIGHVLRINERIVNVAAQHRRVGASDHLEVAQEVLMVVLVIRRALAAAASLTTGAPYRASKANFPAPPHENYLAS